MANSKRLLAALTGVIATTAGLPARADWSLVNMPVGVTELSHDVHGLHMLILWVCVAIAVFTFGAMIYALVKFRKSKGAVADTTLLHSTKLEIAWTIIPVFILIGMAIPSVETLIKIEDTTGSEMTIKATGYQWFWQYDYLDSGVSFYSRLAESSNETRQLGSGKDPRSVENYLLDVDHPPAADRQRRHPLLVGPRLRHEARRDPRLHQRDVDQGGRGQARHLPRAVRGAVRPRPWVHAHRGGGEAKG
jgi:cytochrome c oxidase subunit 2